MKPAKQQTTELMSPCQNFETLNAAINAGCNSVYFGLKQLNMRTGRSKNFELKDLKKIKQICEKNSVNCYLTLNSIIYDNELKEVDKILKEVKKQKINAVIASDWAVVIAANKLGIPVHISTQQSCSNIGALKFFSKYAERIVLARELSLEQIKEIKKIIIKEKVKGSTGKLMQIECFCHGAMCVSISGRCFLSQFLQGNECSANRGKCLQNCRREYIIKDAEKGHEIKIGQEEGEAQTKEGMSYAISPKDLCTIEILDKLEGVIDVLKIEGRGRNTDYVYVVTKTYREALDAIAFNNFNSKLKKELVNNLKKVYNRGFSKGFYLGKPLNEWSKTYGNKATEKRILLGKVINYYGKAKVAEISIESGETKLKEGDQLVFTGETTGYYSYTATEIRNSEDNKKINSAKKGQKITVKTKKRLRINDKVFVLR
jgi:U32 family peptidase